jgi:hypothetical protein
VQPEALGYARPNGGALEEVKRARALGDRVHSRGRENLDARDHALHAAPGGSLDLVGEADDGDGERDVGLDGRDDVAHRRLGILEQAQHAVARLDQHRVGLQRLEGRGQTAAMTLVVMAFPRRVWIGRSWIHCRRCHRLLTHPSGARRPPVIVTRYATAQLIGWVIGRCSMVV